MNSPHETYARHAERVARLLAWLEAGLERHGERANDIDEPARLWPMVGRLAYIEEELKFPLMLLSGMAEAEIDAALNEGGQGDE